LAPSPRARAGGAPVHADREPWLPGFAWAVPAAFGGAVSACRFEQGDVLHASRTGYGDWSKGTPGVWLQVLDPPRSARAAGGGADASRFETHWGSPLELEIDLADGSAPRRLASTQGRLFTCLWRGDSAALESTAAPSPPLLLAALQRRLDAALPALRRALGGGGGSKRASKASAGDERAMLFVMGVDRASDASLAKADTIASALASRFEVRWHDVPPAEAGVGDAEEFHPPLFVRGIRIEAADEDAVTAALKAVLYTPGARARASGDENEVDDAAAEAPATRSDRFSLSRHGLLAALVDDSD